MCEIKDCFLIETGYWIDKKKKIFKRNEIIPKALENAVRIKRNNNGVFKTAYSYNIENQNEAFLYGDFYLDFDSQDFEEVREDAIMAISYLKIVFKIDADKSCSVFYSGNKGVHIIVPATILGITPDKKLNETFKAIANAISEFTKNKTLDLRIYDNKRMFRMANSKHEVTNRYKIYLSINELKELSHEEIMNLACNPREIPKKETAFSNEAHRMYITFKERAEKTISKFKNLKSNGTLKYTPPCIKEILKDGAVSGKRNNTIAILSSFYKATGKDLNETITLLKEWNKEKNNIPTSDSELIKTCRSIYLKDNQFGCTSIKALNLCSDEKCNFRK